MKMPDKHLRMPENDEITPVAGNDAPAGTPENSSENPATERVERPSNRGTAKKPTRKKPAPKRDSSLDADNASAGSADGESTGYAAGAGESGEGAERAPRAAQNSEDAPAEAAQGVDEAAPARKKRKKKKRSGGAALPEWDDFDTEDRSERRGPRGLNEFSSRQRDGQSADGNRGGGRNDGGRNDGNRNGNRNQASGNNAARSQDGRGRDGDARRNGNNRNGQGQRSGGSGAAKKSTGGGWKSLRFALKGVKTGYWNEAHLAVHTLAAILALGASWYLNIPPAHTAAVLLAIGGVMAAEFFNTALETLADALQPRPHGGVGKAKDLAAAGVLMAVLVAVGVGVVVFGPALWTLVSSWM